MRELLILRLGLPDQLVGWYEEASANPTGWGGFLKSIVYYIDQSSTYQAPTSTHPAWG